MLSTLWLEFELIDGTRLQMTPARHWLEDQTGVCGQRQRWLARQERTTEGGGTLHAQLTPSALDEALPRMGGELVAVALQQKLAFVINLVNQMFSGACNCTGDGDLSKYLEIHRLGTYRYLELTAVYL